MKLYLAPMDGYTDSAFRRLVRELSPEVVLVTEMVCADALAYDSQKTRDRMKFDSSEHPIIIQLFGKVPEHMAIAARIAEEMGADGIDVNMGCPARKVVGSGHGSDLIRHPEVAEAIVRAIKGAVKIPLSVKTRLGWDDKSTILEFGKRMQDAGADLIQVHGRTVRQAFSGEADLSPIYELKKILDIPVIGNGDIDSYADAKAKLKNLDGMMIGRAVFGNPWIFSEAGMPNDFLERIPVILRHCELAIEGKGERKGMLEMRKHLAKYVHGIDGASEYRARLVRVETLADVRQIMTDITNSIKKRPEYSER